MRIGFDYTPAARERAGIGRFARGLISGLAELRPQHEISLVYAADAEPGSALPFPARRLPLPERVLTLLWQRARVPVPLDALAGPFDVFHSPNFVLPPLRRARGVVTVHDLSFLVVPECAEPSLVRYLERAVPASLDRATIICADSLSTANDLSEYLHVPPERVRVVYGAVDQRFRPIADEAVREAVRRKYRLPGAFALFVGTIEPRKNLARLAQAFRRARKSLGLPHRLVLAGGRGWRQQDVMAGLDLDADDAVLLAGFIEDDDLPALYSLADAFLYPALYEGFGLPVLEALACGTPTVCGSRSSLPEVAGEIALQVPPDDADALAGAIERVLTDLALRERSLTEGPAQAAKFSWRKSAEALVAAYEAAAR